MKKKNFNLLKLNSMVITTIGLGLLNVSYAQSYSQATNNNQSETTQNTNKANHIDNSMNTNNGKKQENISTIHEYQGSTIEKIKNSGKILVGIKSASIPLSYTTNLKESGKPLGYALDICNGVIDRFKLKYMLSSLQTQYVFVTEQNNIMLMKNGTIDIDCNSTTNNENNRKDVNFSIPYYISSTKIMALNKRADLQNILSFKAKSIAYIKGSTVDTIITEFNNSRHLNINKIEVLNAEDGLLKLKEGKVDGFAYDDLILYGLNNNNKDNEYKILSETLSIDPQAIMLRKNDKEFFNFINEEMKNLIKTGQVQNLYDKWFLSPIAPQNKTIGIQQSKLLKDVFRYPTIVVGN